MANKIEYYTPKEIMEMLGVSKNTAYKLLKMRLFPCVKVGGLYKIPKRSFDDWSKKDYSKSIN